jgi:phosphoglycerate dehydrogenase-like enzyme
MEPRHLARLQDVAPRAEIVDAGQEGVNEVLPTADIFIGHAKVPVDWDRVVAAGRLKWIQSSAAGLDHCLVPSVIGSSIVVTSASGLFAMQVAEQTMALLLGLLRSAPTFFRQQQQRVFVRRPTADLRGKTVLIVGLGGNGRQLVRVLHPFGVTLLATDYYPDAKPTEVQQLLPADRLDELLPLADIVILTLPLNTSTRGLFDARRLRLLKRGAWLINVARGPVIVERDLVAVLESGHLRGCGLDVTEVEPLPRESPLWTREDVMISPHVGAQSNRRYDDATGLIAENLRRYLSGEKLWNVVDKTLGFPRPEAVWSPALDNDHETT